MPRQYFPNEIIHEELEEISEMTFVEKGTYYVGYEINRERKMKLHFPPGNIIGAVNTIFLGKSRHVYQCKFQIEGYAINREKWKVLDK